MGGNRGLNAKLQSVRGRVRVHITIHFHLIVSVGYSSVCTAFIGSVGDIGRGAFLFSDLTDTALPRPPAVRGAFASDVKTYGSRHDFLFSAGKTTSLNKFVSFGCYMILMLIFFNVSLAASSVQHTFVCMMYVCIYSSRKSAVCLVFLVPLFNICCRPDTSLRRMYHVVSHISLH